jgi:hypothetical protein
LVIISITRNANHIGTVFPSFLDPTWSCACTATLKILAQKDGKMDEVRKYSQLVNPTNSRWGHTQMSFDVGGTWKYRYFKFKVIFFLPLH